MTQLTIRPARAEDIAQFNNVHLTAFGTNADMSNVFPGDTPAMRVFWEQAFTHDFADPYTRFQVVEDPATNKIVAFAKWVAPKPKDAPHAALPGLDTWPKDDGGDPERAVKFFADMAEQHARIMRDPATGEPIPHWYLDMICTHPDHQGRGAAGLLLRYGEGEADAAGLPCYLDATPAGRVVYESPGHGFKVLDTKYYLGGDYPQYSMRRDPKGQ